MQAPEKFQAPNIKAHTMIVWKLEDGSFSGTWRLDVGVFQFGTPFIET
jgi:hypothetical protein